MKCNIKILILRQLFVLLILTISFPLLFGQISEERMAELMPGTKIERLKELAGDYERKFLERKRVAEARAIREGWPLRKELEDGTIYEIVGFEGNMPEYLITTNHIAAQTLSTNLVYPDGGFNYNLTGKGLFVGEWDGGAVLLSHDEFGGRAIQIDGAGSISNHATHVGGTLIGGGANPEARGMSYEADLWAHDWNSDNAEMAEAAAQGLLISNHSYGSITGWANGDWSGTNGPHWWGDPEIDEEQDYNFGRYNGGAVEWDEISYNAPYYLIVKSAGNDRGNSGSSEHHVFQNGDWELVDIVRPSDGGALGYDCIPSSGNAKNILTIGAVRGIPNGFTQPSDINMSSFSGWGPTDDGRIKPDVVGNGVQVLSASSGGNSSYASLSGTSMSGPNVAGSLLLLQQLHNDLFGKFMLSSTLKALVIHTADSATGESRPDYRNGWGLVNIKKAADVLSQPFFHQFEEITLTDGDTIRREILSNGIEAIKVTIAWTDFPGIEADAVLNSRTPRLIDDLDVRIRSLDDSSVIYMPFILDPENPENPASTGDNFIDNVEVIYPGIVPAGKYIVEISHKQNLFNSSIVFSLVTTSPLSECQLTTEDRVEINLPCYDPSALTDVVIEQEEGIFPFQYKIGNNEFQDENVFTDLSPGNHLVLVKDSSECIGVINILIKNPDEITVDLSPELRFHALAGDKEEGFASAFAGNAGWGGPASETMLSAKAVFVDDGSNNGILGCDDIVNSEDIAGNIALVRRGSCEFGLKALNAQIAGAIAVIIINNEPGVMTMGAGAVGNQVNIPVYMIPNSAEDILFDLQEEGELSFEIGEKLRIRQANCAEPQGGFIDPLIMGGIGDYTLLWNTGDTTAILEGAGPGEYFLEVRDSNFCEASFSFEIPEIFSPQPLIITSDETCLGDNDGAIFISNPQQLEDYNFFLEGEEQGFNFQNLAAGMYFGVLRNSLDCEVQLDSLMISAGADVPILDILGDTLVSFDEPATYNVDPEGWEGTYDWSIVNGEIISGQGTQEVTVEFFNPDNDAALMLTLVEGECRKSMDLNISAEPNSNTLYLDKNSGLSIFPVPARNILNVKIENHLTSQSDKIYLLNSTGQIIESYTTMPKQEIDISGLATGLYFINWEGKSVKFIKI